MDNVITDSYCLAEYCKFVTLKDDLIRDRTVVGLKDKKLSEQLHEIIAYFGKNRQEKPGSQRHSRNNKHSFREKSEAP